MKWHFGTDDIQIWNNYVNQKLPWLFTAFSENNHSLILITLYLMFVRMQGMNYNSVVDWISHSSRNDSLNYTFMQIFQDIDESPAERESILCSLDLQYNTSKYTMYFMTLLRGNDQILIIKLNFTKFTKFLVICLIFCIWTAIALEL